MPSVRISTDEAKELLERQAPSTLDAYPVRLELPIAPEDWDAYGNVSMMASHRWREGLEAAYLQKVGFRRLNAGGSSGGDFRTGDQAVIACASVLMIVDEAQRGWSGNARGDVILVRETYFVPAGPAMRVTGGFDVMPTLDDAGVAVIDDEAHARIEALEGRAIPRVKWSARFGRGWSEWLNKSIATL